MAMYEVTFALLAHATASAVVIGGGPAHDEQEAEQKARLSLHARAAYRLGRCRGAAEQVPGESEWAYINLIPKGLPGR